MCLYCLTRSTHTEKSIFIFYILLSIFYFLFSIFYFLYSIFFFLYSIFCFLFSIFYILFSIFYFSYLSILSFCIIIMSSFYRHYVYNIFCFYSHFFLMSSQFLFLFFIFYFYFHFLGSHTTFT